MAIGKHMAASNGYTPMQSSSLYVTDGDEIDWAYGTQRIWMYTFELYPSHGKVSGNARFYPADELIARETTRNKEAILYLIEHAGCLYSVDRHDPGELRAVLRRLRDRPRLDREPARDRYRDGREPGSAGTPQATARQSSTAISGSRALVDRGCRPARASTPTTSTASPPSARR